MYAARSRSRWEATSASAGASRSVRANSLDMRMREGYGTAVRRPGSSALQHEQDVPRAGVVALLLHLHPQPPRHPPRLEVGIPHDRGQPGGSERAEGVVAARQRGLGGIPSAPEPAVQVISDLQLSNATELLPRETAIPD